MTPEMLERYRADAGWNLQVSRIDPVLSQLKKEEEKAIASEKRCSWCSAPLPESSTVCPYCGAPVTSSADENKWKKVAATPEMLQQIEEAWTIYSEIYRIQNRIDREFDAVELYDVARKQAAEMMVNVMDQTLSISTEEILDCSNYHKVFVADYFFGLLEERYPTPFVTLNRMRAEII